MNKSLEHKQLSFCLSVITNLNNIKHDTEKMNNSESEIFLWYLEQNCDKSFRISWHLCLNTLISLTINDFSKDAVVFIMYNHHFPSYGLHCIGISFQNSFSMFITIIFCTLHCFRAQNFFRCSVSVIIL